LAFIGVNCDFNASGTAFEKLKGRDIFDALETDLARPLGTQDFDRKKQRKNQTMPEEKISVHPEYAIYLSTRDMARLGLLVLRDSKWTGVAGRAGVGLPGPQFGAYAMGVRRALVGVGCATGSESGELDAIHGRW
jgi:CubicO group peptidase (beta-lactamase class C family)